MQIIDLNEEYRNLFFVCLEDWSEEIKEAGNHKEIWYNKMKDKGLIVKLAIDDDGHVGGMIQCVPSEYSSIECKDLYFINCIWIHGHKKGRGKALLQAIENEVKEKGAKGISAWGISLPFWMKAGWFKKQGYKKVDRDGIAVLLWKPFSSDAVLYPTKEQP
jgi:N-acetylglutamate synthase-like GNAT family acetyltransferase